MAASRGIVAGGGAIVIYLSIAMLPQLGWDFSWPLWFWQDWQEGRHAIVGGIMLGVFWWRGTHLGQELVWVNNLAQSFRIGVAVVVVGVVVDVLIESYSGAPIPTFLFFGMGIASFALIHITSMDPEQSAGLKDWPRMMALTVGGILIGSVLLAFLAEGELGRVAGTVFWYAGRLFLPILAVIGWVFEIVIQAFVWAFFEVVRFFATEGESPELQLPSAPDFERIFTRDEEENRLLYWLSRIFGWAGCHGGRCWDRMVPVAAVQRFSRAAFPSGDERGAGATAGRNDDCRRPFVRVVGAGRPIPSIPQT